MFKTCVYIQHQGGSFEDGIKPGGFRILNFRKLEMSKCEQLLLTPWVCVSNFRKGSIIKVNHWMALWSNHIKSLDAFCSSQKMGAAISRSSASQMAEICPLPLLGTRTRPRTSNRGWKLTQLRIEVATVNKTPDRRSSRRSNKFI